MEGGEETRQWMQVLPWRRSNMAPSWMVRAVVLAHSETCHFDHFRSISAFSGRWNEWESSGIVEVQTHTIARAHPLALRNKRTAMLAALQVYVCSAADLQRVAASAGSSAYAAPGSMGRTVRSVLPITTARASYAYPA